MPRRDVLPQPFVEQVLYYFRLTKHFWVRESKSKLLINAFIFHKDISRGSFDETEVAEDRTEEFNRYTVIKGKGLSKFGQLLNTDIKTRIYFQVKPP